MSRFWLKIARKLHRRLGRYLAGRELFYPPLDPGPDVSPDQEAQTLTALLADLGHHDTMEHLMMLEAFLSARQHLTAPAFRKLLQDRGSKVSVEKAAVSLELFTSLGFAEKHFAEGGQVIYEHSRPGQHHDHLVCSDCGCTNEFHRPDIDQHIEKIAGDENFRHLHHQLVIYGLCPECRRRRVEGLPLAETAVGETVVVVGLTGPDELRQRLMDMGLHKGAKLTVLGEQSGSIIVLVNETRLAMGPEMATAIMVR